MANLFPESYDEETMDASELVDTTPVGYRPGVAFDLKTGDFVRDGRNRLLDSTGVESWQSWVMNCIETARYKHLAYNSDYGVEWDRVFQAPSQDEAESIMTRQITEAIMADPYQRTAYIDELDFECPADEVERLSELVSTTMSGIVDLRVPLDVDVSSGESWAQAH